MVVPYRSLVGKPASIVCIAALAFSPFLCHASVQPGVVVESLTERFAADVAGLRAGDVLVSWTSSDVAGAINDPLHLSDLEIIRHSPSPVVLKGFRDGEVLSVSILGGEWGLKTRPNFGDETLGRYVNAISLYDTERVGEAHAVLLDMARDFEADGQLAVAVWLMLEAARRRASESGAESAQSTFDVAAGWVEHDTRLLASVLKHRAEVFERHANREVAIVAWHAAIDSSDREPILRARSQLRLAELLGRARDIAGSRTLLEESRATVRQTAPGGLLEAEILRRQAILAAVTGNSDEAERLIGESLAILTQVAPRSYAAAANYVNFGNLARRRGDLAGAEASLQQGLALNEYFDPEGLQTAIALNNLGLVAKQRGDLVRAEALYVRSLSIKRSIPGGDGIAEGITLGNLGNIAFLRGELDRAFTRHSDALAIFESLRPDSELVATANTSLGDVELERGNLDAAFERFQHAAEVNRRFRPGSLGHAYSLEGVGIVAAQRGNLDEAERLFLESQVIREQQAPNSADAAEGFLRFSELAGARGDDEGQLGHLKRAFEIQRQLIPETAALAETSHALARLTRQLGDENSALEYYATAVDALERQRLRLGGGDEIKSRFSEKYGPVYKEYAEMLIERDEAERAFRILERYRARVLLSMIAERDLLLHAESPRRTGSTTRTHQSRSR